MFAAITGRHAAPRGQRSGTLISTPIDGGPVVTRDTMSCIHCAYTWIVAPGSGKHRGYCTRCCGFVCGRRCCRERGCVHREQLLENMEAGASLDFRPIIVSVPAAPPGALFAGRG